MRILVFTEENLNQKDFIEKANKELIAKVDWTNDYYDAEYMGEIRNYDYIFIQFYQKFKLKYLSFLKNTISQNPGAEIILFGEDLDYLNDPRYDMFNVEKITENLTEKDIFEYIKDNTEEIIEKENLKIDIKQKKIWVSVPGEEKIEITFKKEFNFYVFLYFVRHYKEAIDINSLLNATVEEPELTKDSIVESAISAIRKTFKDIFQVNPIRSFKKVGYEFSLSNVNY